MPQDTEPMVPCPGAWGILWRIYIGGGMGCVGQKGEEQ